MACAEQINAVDGAFGPPYRWPGWFFDSIAVLKRERARDERAQEAAVRRA
jgi:hypothetical protein